MSPTFIRLLISTGATAVVLFLLSHYSVNWAVVGIFALAFFLPWLVGLRRSTYRTLMRLAIELLGPGLLWTLLMLTLIATLSAFTGKPGPSLRYLVSREMLQVTGIVYLVAAIPSLGYMLLMELGFALGLKRRSWPFLAYSTFIGALSGASLAVPKLMGWGGITNFLGRGDLVKLTMVAAISALLIGAILVWLEPKKETHP